MARKIFSKVVWVGRTAATVLGLALVLALVFGVATTAVGATGGKFILGKANNATTVSKLTASIAGPALTLVNNSTNAAATALNISVASGQAPLKVNAEAGTATNLSADRLDGLDSSHFAQANTDGSALHAVSAGNADKLDGKDSDEILPFVRAQKDKEPTSSTEPASCCPTVNTVSIAAPTDGFFVISGSTEFSNHSLSDQGFALWAAIDDQWVGGRG